LGERRGYVGGRELREGCLVPSIGGGLCQLSNALYDAALRAGFEIVERHAHTATVAGSLAEIGRDATVFWNYIDLRFRPEQDVRIEVSVTTDSLVVRYWAVRVETAPSLEIPFTPAVAPLRPMSYGDCASCAVENCFRHIPERARADSQRAAFLLDAYWPEYDTYLASVARPMDVAFMPLNGHRRGLANYRWNASSLGSVHESAVLTLLRSFQTRRMAQNGPARQTLLIEWARRIANDFAARLPYDVTHAIVMQHFLPALWTGKHLGGRTYDVLMTGMPLRVLQNMLDRAYALHPESPTLRDFRAEPRLLEAEESALAGARKIVTPHLAVAALFGGRAERLPWALPPPLEPPPAGRSGPRKTVIFPGPTLGRAGAYEMRDVARELNLHVLLTGPTLEGEGFWDGVSVEHKTFSQALGAGPVVLPAFVEHQPRRLLLAAAMTIPVVASDACGLDRDANVDIVPAGDVPALNAAVTRAFAHSDRS
jgi:hypothetical protein